MHANIMDTVSIIDNDLLSDSDLDSVVGGGKLTTGAKIAYAVGTVIVEEALEWLSGLL